MRIVIILFTSNGEVYSSSDRIKMATENENANIFGTTTDRMETPKTNLGFSTTASSKKVSPDYCENDRQLDMAIWPIKPEVHMSISGNVRDNMEIPTENLRFSTATSSKKQFADD